jgi:hypothetical protein
LKVSDHTHFKTTAYTKRYTQGFALFFGSKPVRIRSTPKAVTHFGGLCSLFEFFNKIGLASKLQEVMLLTLFSPNAIPPARGEDGWHADGGFHHKVQRTRT